MTNRLTKPPSDQAWLDYKLSRARADARRGPKTATFTIVVDDDPNPAVGSYARIMSHGASPVEYAIAIGQMFYMLAKLRPDLPEIEAARQEYFKVMKMDLKSSHSLKGGKEN